MREGIRTDIEAMTEAVLIDLGIAYLFDHKVSRWVVDFALPELGIALECDGWHHTTIKGQARDIERDAALRELGWEPIHVADLSIRKDADSAIRVALKLNHL